MVEAAPLLAQDDDAGFMTKVALLTKPKPESKKLDDKKSDKKPEKKKVEE